MNSRKRNLHGERDSGEKIRSTRDEDETMKLAKEMQKIGRRIELIRQEELIKRNDEKIKQQQMTLRKLDWTREQEFYKKHEKLKQQMISDYEKRRVEDIKPRETYLHSSNRNKSSGTSSYYQEREKSTSKSDNTYKHLGASTSTASFKHSKDPPINNTESRGFKNTDWNSSSTDVDYRTSQSWESKKGHY